jgi:hypothetical protein
MRVYWASVEVKFVTGHFEIKNPEDNAALNYATAPAGGTDASTVLGLGAGLGSVSSSSGTTASAVTEPVKYSSRAVVITRATTDPYHFNYWGLYRSKDVGVNGTDALLGVGNQPEKGLWVADIAIDTLTYTDTTSDDNLREEEAQRVLATRTFVSLPNCNTGAVANGFLAGADTDGEEISYCQIKYLKDYQMGYHYNGEDGQYDTISDTIKRVTSFPDCVVAYGSRSIWRASTTQGQKNELPDFGITIGFMTQFSKIADWGIFDRFAINESTIRNKRYDIIKTSDGKIVLFDGYEFSKDYAKDMSSLMKKLQNISASSYSHMTGFRYFGTEDAVNTAGGSY